MSPFLMYCNQSHSSVVGKERKMYVKLILSYACNV